MPTNSSDYDLALDQNEEPFGAYDPTEEEEESKEVRCEYVTGAAGTGKTFSIRKRIEEDPTYGLLCATTGIAGVNLGTTTINAQFGYFDTDSLRQKYISGKLITRMAEFATQYKNLVVDECSMLAAEQLDIFHEAAKAANQYEKVKKSKNPDGIGIVLTGDFCQLPPIKSKWAFDADCWPLFEQNTTVLTKNWRQADGQFLEGINSLRRGDGLTGSNLLRDSGVEFANANLLDYPGTTILAKNQDVDRYNWVALSKLQAEEIKVKSERWTWKGQYPPSEWKLIPDELKVKKGAYVMILANDSPAFTYANGDCGWVEDIDPTTNMFTIKLARNDKLVSVPMVERPLYVKEDPKTLFDGDDSTELVWSKKIYLREGIERPWGEPHLDLDRDKYVAGSIKYSPVRLAYAATVHKTQGLTLDRVQMDIRHGFFGSPAMIYVAVSRCRTAQGLRIVGSPQLLAQRCKIAEEVKRWL
jgi:ATP-dependent DNA helicase PIF1